MLHVAALRHPRPHASRRPLQRAERAHTTHVLDEVQLAAGGEDAADGGHGDVDVGRRAEGADRDHGIERAVGLAAERIERAPRQVPGQVGDAGVEPARREGAEHAAVCRRVADACGRQWSS